MPPRIIAMVPKRSSSGSECGAVDKIRYSHMFNQCTSLLFISIICLFLQIHNNNNNNIPINPFYFANFNKVGQKFCQSYDKKKIPKYITS